MIAYHYNTSAAWLNKNVTQKWRTAVALAGPSHAFEVHYVPKEFCPDVSSSDYGEEDDTVWVTSVGDPFMYVIPSFAVMLINPVKNVL